MAFHHIVQSILLAGVRLPASAAPIQAPPPPAVAALAAAVAPHFDACNARAIKAGNRYRSAFWALYLLSALAVLCAVMPLAVGWDDARHDMHDWAGVWVVAEVIVIAALGITYWRGHHHDWQGQWIAARTEAELTSYLPLLAPLIAFGADAPSNWYRRLPGLPMGEGQGVEALCATLEPQARAALERAWDDPAWRASYVGWAAAQLDGQRSYHQRVALRNDALKHRVHTINAVLFGLTFAGALAHLVIHSIWLSLVTIFFPALAASLHGALAQTEAYRLAAASRRMEAELATLIVAIGASSGPQAERAAIGAALALILDEHKDWHMLVLPHHLPLG